MIRVKMTPNLKERPPRIIGPFTVKRLLYTAIGVAVGLPLALIIPADIPVRIIIGALFAAPPIVVGWLPETGTSPVTIIRSFLKAKVASPGIRVHDGDNQYLGKENVKIKVKRSSKRKGWK